MNVQVTFNKLTQQILQNRKSVTNKDAYYISSRTDGCVSVFSRLSYLCFFSVFFFFLNIFFNILLERKEKSQTEINN